MGEQEQEKERHQIRLLMSEPAQVDQSGDFFDDDQTWDFNQHVQVNTVSSSLMPRETEQLPKDVAMTEKEQKQMEKALKQQQEKEEKERKKQEKDIRKQEE